MPKVVRKFGLAVRYLYLRFVEEGFSYRAASLAYATLMATVPLTIIGFTILSAFPTLAQTGEKVRNFILTNFVASSAKVIEGYLGEFIGHVSSLSVFNLIFLIVIGVLVMYNVNCAFNSVWRVKQRKVHLSLSFIVYLLVLLLSPILLAGLLLVVTFVSHMPYFAGLLSVEFVHKPLFFLLPHVLIFITFTLLNWILPSCRVRLIHAMLGGLLTTLLFELAKYGFSLYLTHFSTYRKIYGALATIPIFLIWLYIAWVIILLGALITHIVAKGIPEHYEKLKHS